MHVRQILQVGYKHFAVSSTNQRPPIDVEKEVFLGGQFCESKSWQFENFQSFNKHTNLLVESILQTNDCIEKKTCVIDEQAKIEERTSKRLREVNYDSHGALLEEVPSQRDENLVAHAAKWHAKLE